MYSSNHILPLIYTIYEINDMHNLPDVNTSNLIYQDISTDGIKLFFRNVIETKEAGRK